jgi:hypothetical protein
MANTSLEPTPVTPFSFRCGFGSAGVTGGVAQFLDIGLFGMRINLLITALFGMVIAGCASRRDADHDTLRPGVTYTTPLGGGLVAEVKRDKKTDTIDVYIMRDREVVAQFGASERGSTSQHTLNPEGGARWITIDVIDGKLKTHTLAYRHDNVEDLILDRDGDFFPDQRWSTDLSTQAVTRETITHSYAPTQKEK